MYIQMFVILWIYAHMWMFVKCGKLQKNVGNFVDKMWECGKHVENMWKTHLYVQMCDFVGNYTNVSQFFFFFFFFFFFVRRYVCRHTYMCAVVLFNCMFSHICTERERRTCRSGCAYKCEVFIYLIR